MKKENVLLIAANDMGNSGVPNVFMQIVRNLSDKYIFDIIITRENYYYKEEFLSYGGSIHVINEIKKNGFINKVLWRCFGLKKYIQKKLKIILRQKQYSIIHSFKEEKSWYFFKLAKRMGINQRIIHNNRVWEPSKNLFLRTYLNLDIKKSLKYSTANISVSRKTGQSFFGNHFFTVIYNSYDEHKYHFLKGHKSSNVISLLQIGTFLPIKNQTFTIEVIKEIISRNIPVSCIFLGKIFDKSYYNSLLKRIDESNLSSNISFEKNDRASLELLEKITYSLVPSLIESFSLVSVESQACGIKVFASNGVPKEIDLGNIEFTELDPKKWADKIIEDFTKTKGKRKKVDTSRFSNKIFKEKIQKIYDLNN